MPPMVNGIIAKCIFGALAASGFLLGLAQADAPYRNDVTDISGLYARSNRQ